MRRTQLLSQARKVVVKVGSNVLFDGTDVDRAAVAALCRDAAALVAGGRDVVIVSSGAIACGRHRLGLSKRPDTLPELQAAAAVGQSMLMELYEDALSQHGFHAGQMLLTREDFADRTRYLNARNTLRALLSMKAVPVINENDTVAVEEIRFGENDVLSAQVANLVQANVLVILSTVEGLYEDFARTGRGGRIVAEVEGVDEAIAAMATASKSDLGTGGMATKLEAAKMVTASGGAALIAGGKLPDVLSRIFAGEKLGTLFYPTREHMAGRKRWIGYGARAAGEIVVDDGAKTALTAGGKSLLPSGIVAVRGEFTAGEVVSVRAKEGEPFARGVVQYSAAEIEKIKGHKTGQIAGILGLKPYDEVIHRDDMTVL